MNNNLFVVAFLVGIGAYMLLTACMARAGRTREWFVIRPNPIVPKDIVYGAIPLGVGFILAGLGFAIENYDVTLLSLLGGVVLGYILMFWKPRWLKPDWLLQLEDTYGPKLVEQMLRRGELASDSQLVWASDDSSPKNRRFALVALGLICISLFSIAVSIELNHSCTAASETECRFLQGITFVSVLGGALLMETLIRRKQAIKEKRILSDSLDMGTASQYIIYIVLFGLLTAAPLIIRGAFALAFGGGFIGFGLDSFVRGVLNWLPPTDDES
jgi:hypothetical protein